VGLKADFFHEQLLINIVLAFVVLVKPWEFFDLWYEHKSDEKKTDVLASALKRADTPTRTKVSFHVRCGSGQFFSDFVT